MLRQRLRLRTPRLALVGRVVTLLIALALVWYGLMLVLLALGTDPHTINLISGYRTAYDFLAELTPDDVGEPLWKRLILIGGGLLAALIFLPLAFKELPRPYLARHTLELGHDNGDLAVAPRAVERIAETAATRDRAVTSATGRFETDAIAVDVAMSRAQDLPDALVDVRDRVRAAIREHGLPDLPVHVTLAGFDAKTRRELS